MKPRIMLILGMWCCTGRNDYTWGSGFTPEDAYWAWVHDNLEKHRPLLHLTRQKQ